MTLPRSRSTRLQDVFRHRDGVGALALGDGNGHGGKRALAIRVAHILRRLLTTIAHLGDVAHKDRLVVGNSGNDIADIVRRAQKLPGLQEKLLVAARELARRADGDWKDPALPRPELAIDCRPPGAPDSE